MIFSFVIIFRFREKTQNRIFLLTFGDYKCNQRVQTGRNIWLQRLMNILQFNYEKFFTEDLWSIQIANMPWPKQIGIKVLRVLTLAVNGYLKDRCGFRASALTYFTLLSIVPVMALAFGIAKGFDLDKKLEGIIFSSLKGQEEIAHQLVDFSERMLSSAQGDIVAGFGFVVLFYSVMKLIYNIETSFNDIWSVKATRSIARKFTDYTTMIVIAPILVIISSSLNVMVMSKLREFSQSIDIAYINEYAAQGVTFAAQLSPYLMLIALFTLVYMIMPYTRVNLKFAFISGIFSGYLIQTIQWLYLDLQIGVSSYNAIYGSFAALPLLMIFFQLSWQIVLFGAELCNAMQSVEEHERNFRLGKVSLRHLKIIGLLICREVVRAFEGRKEPVRLVDIEHNTHVPFFYLEEAAQKLVQGKILISRFEAGKEPEEMGLVPALPLDQMTVFTVLDSLEKVGFDDATLGKLPEDLEEMDHLLLRLDQDFENSEKNVLVKTI
ncbi:hypothetical protein PEDI_02370 [Persicobacter diffluens]|uniref:YihY/virulence factor BrkB family protein n=2 Tax=Persicobacter diffluens TaxID=981 RepID=A0AAN4VVP8_9BACT|nr:hypothetical protein PEDI_02370 [Persicobacter diffluens]